MTMYWLVTQNCLSLFRIGADQIEDEDYEVDEEDANTSTSERVDPQTPINVPRFVIPGKTPTPSFDMGYMSQQQPLERTPTQRKLVLEFLYCQYNINIKLITFKVQNFVGTNFCKNLGGN